MPLGTCVVASDAPGLRSVVTDGVNGISFPVNDANACARALKKALTDVAYRTKLQSAAKAEAPLRFNVERRSRDVGDVYTRILRS
jgi:glycosyltransferase involved in cell wall biosynthesis